MLKKKTKLCRKCRRRPRYVAPSGRVDCWCSSCRAKNNRRLYLALKEAA